MQRVLLARPRSDAIFCYVVVVAHGVLRGLRQFASARETPCARLPRKRGGAVLFG